MTTYMYEKYSGQIPMLENPSERNTWPVPKELSFLVESFTQTDGDYTTAISGLTLHRRKAPTLPLHCIYGLSLGLAIQGSKQVLLGDDVIRFGPGETLLTTLDLPVVSTVTHATSQQPFLGLMLSLEPHTITQLAAEMNLPAPRDDVYRPIAVETLDTGLNDALVRLVKLLEEPQLLPQLAPLIKREITVRLLLGPHGSQLRFLAAAGSPSQQIARVVAWLGKNFLQSLPMDELASMAHMSPSNFRQHFRAITGTSPLQYQKQLRLQEARQLMLNNDFDASTAAVRVGYESTSQFNREYSRLFGDSPQRDIKRRREVGFTLPTQICRGI